MARHYFLESDDTLDHGITSGPTLPDGAILAGTPVDPRTLPALDYEVDLPANAPWPHFLTGGTVLASTRFVEVLEAAGARNFERFPARLRNPETGQSRDDYVLLNVLGLYAATDPARSRGDTLVPGDVGIPALQAMIEVVLDAERTPNLHMFRLAEDPSLLVIDAHLRAALRAHAPEGGWGIMLEALDER
jgi:hypothetical protein